MKKIILIVVCLSYLTLLSSTAMACGGVDLTDDQIVSLPYVLTVEEKIDSFYGTTVVVESIVRSGNDLLDLNKKVVVTAMCAANYINIYLVPKIPGDLLCMTTFQIKSNGTIDFSGVRAGAECRSKKGVRSDWISVPVAH